MLPVELSMTLLDGSGTGIVATADIWHKKCGCSMRFGLLLSSMVGDRIQNKLKMN